MKFRKSINTPKRDCSNKQQGALLIESMVAIAIFSIALLSLSGLQLSAAKNSLSSAFRTESAIASSQIIDMMRSNLAGVFADEYDFGYGDPLPADSTTVQAEKDIRQWLIGLDTVSLRGMTPEGEISCAVVTTPNCSIALRWNDTRAGSIGQDIDAADEDSIPTVQFEYFVDINL